MKVQQSQDQQKGNKEEQEDQEEEKGNAGNSKLQNQEVEKCKSKWITLVGKGQESRRTEEGKVLGKGEVLIRGKEQTQRNNEQEEQKAKEEEEKEEEKAPVNCASAPPNAASPAVCAPQSA